MKGRVIAIGGAEDRGIAAALIVDGRLEDLFPAQPMGSLEPNAGDIAVARVTRKLPKAGAFCEMAGGIEGYLRDAKAVTEGARILVQVQSLPEPGKAVTLTTRLLFKGPRLILTPDAPGVNVSRKIGNESERVRLKAVVEAALRTCDLAAGTPEHADRLGVIVRSAARGAEAEVLEHEFAALLAELKERHARLHENGLAPGVGGDPVCAAFRDWLSPRPDTILCTPDLARNLTSGTGSKASAFADRKIAALIRAEADPFEAAGVRDAIAALASPEIPFAGSSMIVEATQALVAVDVNTKGDFTPAAGLKANLAAARDLPRQLRLRGLGGQVVVDFAPMPKAQRRMLEEALKKAFRDDPVETILVGWTKLGLFEMQRKRERRPLTEARLP